MIKSGTSLMRDSAVDNQVFVSMCSPARDLSAGYHAVSDQITTDDPLLTELLVGTFHGG